MKKIFCILGLAFFIFSCQDDVAEVNGLAVKIDGKITATLEGDIESRTYLDEGTFNSAMTNIFWESQDVLSVFMGTTENLKYVLTSGEGESMANFKGSFNGDAFVSGGTETDGSTFKNIAFYPYKEKDITIVQSGDNYEITTSLPKLQTYKQNSFGKDVFPMISISESRNFKFKNVLGLINIPLKGSAVISEVVVESKAHKLSGECKITASEDESPTITMLSNAESKIILDCGEGVTLETENATNFIFALPPATYEGDDLTFTFYDTDGHYWTFVAANQDEVKRSIRRNWKAKEYVASEETLIVNENLLKSALQSETSEKEPIVISSDIELSEQLVVSNSTTIDLNGKVISVSDNSSTYSSRAGEETGFTGDALLVVKRGTTLTIKDSGNGGRIDTGENSALMGAIKMTELGEDANGDKASLIVEGGTIKGYYYGIMGNGNRHDTSIEIKGGTIEAYCEDDNTGIFHPQNGTLTISGGTIKGYNAAVEMRAGTLKISGGAFFSTATPLTVEGNGSGTTTAGAAIAVSQHSTNLDLKVEITGGEFNGYYALNEIDVQDNTTSNISMSVKGGTFNGSIASENCTEFITNGTFSNPSACSYLGENANVTVNMTESYEGPGFSTKSGQTVSLTMAENVVYNATNPLVGSTGTVSQSFQFLQGSTVTIEGGQLTSSVARMFIQNYANLTLEGVEVAPEIPNQLTSTYYYVLSNNCGTVNLNNGTKIIAPASSGVNVFAMDVCKYTTYPSVTVNVNSGASIQGNVEYSGKLDADNGEDTNQKLYVKNGATIKGNLIVPEGCQDARWKGVILESGATIEGNGWVESGATVESLNTVNM